MSRETKRVVLISASPKVSEESTSGYLSTLQAEQMTAVGLEVQHVEARQSLLPGRSETVFEAMLQADALVFTFPLYVFCLPGLLMRFLQDFAAFRSHYPEKERDARVYAVVNCGFLEADINREAVRVIESFSKKMNYFFRFGVQIGGGGMLSSAPNAPFVKKSMEVLNGTFKLMAEDILNCGENPLEDISVAVKFPRRLYYFMGNKGWFSAAKKNGLKKKDLYRKPYAESSKTTTS